MESKVWFITGTSKGFGRIWAESALGRATILRCALAIQFAHPVVPANPNHASVLRYAAPRVEQRYSRGLMAKARLNMRLKCAGLLKPTPYAISLT